MTAIATAYPPRVVHARRRRGFCNIQNLQEQRRASKRRERII